MDLNSKEPSKPSDEGDPLGQINSAVFMNAGKGGIQSAFGIQNAYEQILANGQPFKPNRKPNPSEDLLACGACGAKNRVGARHCGQCGKAL
jgi:hypothetical protein